MRSIDRASAGYDAVVPDPGADVAARLGDDAGVRAYFQLIAG
jgi:hypothetical protein